MHRQKATLLFKCPLNAVGAIKRPLSLICTTSPPFFVFCEFIVIGKQASNVLFSYLKLILNDPA